MKGVQLRADTRANIIREIIQKQRTLEHAAKEWGVDIATIASWIEEYLGDARFALETRANEVMSAAGVTAPPPTDLEFAGSLEEMGFADVLQLMILQRRSCIAKITAVTGSGRAWLSEGEVFDAEFEEHLGERALFTMLSLKHGTFRINFQTEDRIRSIHRSTQALILESAKRSDEAKEIEERVGGSAQVFARSDRALMESVQLRPTDLKTLELFDAKRNLDEVLRASPLDEYATLTQVARLVDEGYLLPGSLKPVAQSVPVVSQRSFARASLILGQAKPFNTKPRRGPRRALLVLAGVTAAFAGVAGFVISRPRAPFAVGIAPVRVSAAALTTPTEPANAKVAAPTERCARGSAFIPGAEFAIGSSSLHPALHSARPQHTRTVADFCLDQKEVSVADYQACVSDGKCDAAHDVAYWSQGPVSKKNWVTARKVRSQQCNVSKPERGNHPINCVSFTHAQAYCTAHGQRLPKEAEWELAARGKQGRKYPWGGTPPSALTVNACGKECEIWHRGVGLLAEFVGTAYPSDDGYPGTAPVGAISLGATPEGVFDLGGNVSEWTADAPTEYGKPPSEVRNAQSAVHITRGGAFSSGLPELTDAAFRFALMNDTFSPSVGFRCASNPLP